MKLTEYKIIFADYQTIFYKNIIKDEYGILENFNGDFMRFFKKYSVVVGLV